MSIQTKNSHFSNHPLTICFVGSARSAYIQSSALALASRGHHVQVISPEPAEIPGVEIIGIPTVPIPKLRTLVTWLRFMHALNRCRVDILHIHHAHTVEGWAALCVDRHPMVVSTMGGDILVTEQGVSTPRSRWLMVKLLRRADLVTVKSDHMLAALQQLMGDVPTNVIKIVWGIDLRQFRPVDATQLRRELGIGPQCPVIFSPKALQPFYRIHLIVEALPQILVRYSDAKLVISQYYAHRAYEEKIKEQAENLGIQDHLVFAGEIKQEEMPYYYSMADITVAIPPSDGVPHAMFESMACGTPNILTALPHYREFVTDRKSAYFVTGSPEEVAKGILNLLGDKKLYVQIVQEGIKVVSKKANLEEEARRMEVEYLHLLKQSISRRSSIASRLQAISMTMLYILLDGRYGSPLDSIRSFAGKLTNCSVSEDMRQKEE